MKRSSTFHLEEDIYDIIDDYKERYGLTSRNDALTRLLIEYRTMILCNNSQERLNNNINIVKNKTNNDTTFSEKVIENNKNDKNIVKEITNINNELSNDLTIINKNKITNEDLKSEISDIINNSYNNMPD